MVTISVTKERQERKRGEKKRIERKDTPLPVVEEKYANEKLG